MDRCDKVRDEDATNSELTTFRPRLGTYAKAPRSSIHIPRWRPPPNQDQDPGSTETKFSRPREEEVDLLQSLIRTRTQRVESTRRMGESSEVEEDKFATKRRNGNKARKGQDWKRRRKVNCLRKRMGRFEKRSADPKRRYKANEDMPQFKHFPMNEIFDRVHSDHEEDVEEVKPEVRSRARSPVRNKARRRIDYVDVTPSFESEKVTDDHDNYGFERDLRTENGPVKVEELEDEDYDDYVDNCLSDDPIEDYDIDDEDDNFGDYEQAQSIVDRDISKIVKQDFADNYQSHLERSKVESEKPNQYPKLYNMEPFEELDSSSVAPPPWQKFWKTSTTEMPNRPAVMRPMRPKTTFGPSARPSFSGGFGFDSEKRRDEPTWPAYGEERPARPRTENRPPLFDNGPRLEDKDDTAREDYTENEREQSGDDGGFVTSEDDPFFRHNKKRRKDRPETRRKLARPPKDQRTRLQNERLEPLSVCQYLDLLRRPNS